MRIDFVFPKFKLLSGAERLILSLARELGERGHEVTIVCHRFDESCRPLAEGLTVRASGVTLDWSGNHYVDASLGYLLAFRLWRWTSPDADVVCLFGPALTMAGFRPRRTQRLFYFCYEPPRAAAQDRGDVLERVGRWRWLLGPMLTTYRRLDHWLVSRVDAVLVNGEFGRERVAAEYGCDSVVITHGVRLAETPVDRAAARRALGISAEARVVLTVNFLHPRKRVDLLLRSWRAVRERVPAAELWIVGDGPESAALRDLATRLDLGGVRFAGFVAESVLPRYYAAADLLCHLAREETFGLTILEAGELGLPVVCSDEGGPRYTVLEGETGNRVEPNERAVAETLASLLADPARAEAMGRRGREWVRSRFTWQRGADDFLSACAAPGHAEKAC